MSGGSIDGMGFPQARQAPPASDLGALYNALRAYPLGGRYFLINGFGETWGWAQATGEQWTPTAVAAWVRQGHIFCDWCGWPGYYSAQSGSGTVVQLGAAGFQTMVKALGMTWLDGANFTVPIGFRQPFGVFPFPRGFPLLESLAGTAVQHGTFSGSQPYTANGYACLVALLPPGGGAYVYGTWTPTSGGVPAADYANFVGQVMAGAGASAGIVRTPYPSTGSGTGTTPPPSKPSTGTPWGKIALIGGAALLAGGGFAYLEIPGVRDWLAGR